MAQTLGNVPRLCGKLIKRDDPNMDLFCPHVREHLLPLAESGDSDNFSRLLLNCARKSFFTTEDGRAGLCPPGTKKGDVVAALFGGRASFILRPRRPAESTGSEVVQWEFIGESYVHSFMDGKFVEDLLAHEVPSEIFTLR